MEQKVLANTKGMSREEWLSWRQKGIGGSDAAAILGLNRYKTPFQVYLEKSGEVIQEDIQSEAAYWGTLHEDMVAKEFEIRSGKKVRRKNMMLEHPDYPFMIANLDRVVIGEKALLECKTTSAYNLKEWDSEEVPESYLVQVQHYLAVTGYEKAYIACLIGGQRFVWKEITRDEELIKMIIESEKRFWEEHVIKRNPPLLDGSSAAEEYLKERFKQSTSGRTVDLKGEYKELINKYFMLKGSISDLEDQKKTIENNIKNELQDAEIGFIDKFQVNWKGYSSSRVDSKVLKSKYPEIYKEVCKESNARKFEIKEVV